MSPSLLIIAVQAMAERIVCIYPRSTTKKPEDTECAVFISPGYENLMEGLDRETALRTAREWFEENERTVVFDHSGGNPVRIAARSTDKLNEMRNHLKRLNLEVEALVWEESF